MAGYIGSKASVVSSGVERKKTYAITTSTTSLTGLNYTVGKVHVYQNGVRLLDGTDYTATNGTSITLTVAAQSGDNVVVVSQASFQLSESYTSTEADARYVQPTHTGNLDITGTVTSDGLTVAGDAVFSPDNDGVRITGTNYATLRLEENDTTDLNSSIFNSSGAFRIYTSNDARTVLTERFKIDHSTGDISFYEDTGTTAKFFWDASAESLGIGTISPSAPLTVKAPADAEAIHVVGRSDDIGQIKFMEADGTTELGIIDARNSFFNIGSIANIPLKFATNNSERMRIDSSGNVGIGSTSSPMKLTVRNGSANSDIAKFTGNDTGGGLTISTASTTRSDDTVILKASDAFGEIAFVSDSTEVMRITKDNNLLVGKTSGGNEVQGTVLYNNGQIYATASGHQVMLLTRKTNNGEIILFYRDGTNVGNIYVTGSSTSYNTSSDYRLKENVVDLTGASARVNQLNPSRFNFIADADTTVDGFLAHEVATVVPEAITGTKDAMKDEEYEVTPAVLDDDGNVTTEAVMGTRSVPDYQGIDQSKLVPLLTAALQEALTEIASLKTRVEALEA